MVWRHMLGEEMLPPDEQIEQLRVTGVAEAKTLMDRADLFHMYALIQECRLIAENKRLLAISGAPEMAVPGGAPPVPGGEAPPGAEQAVQGGG